MSLLSRGAWIEIQNHLKQKYFLLSLLSRGAWIEIGKIGNINVCSFASLLSRGAWIEIL